MSRIIVDKKKRNEKKFPLSGRKREKRIKMFSVVVSSVRGRERERERENKNFTKECGKDGTVRRVILVFSFSEFTFSSTRVEQGPDGFPWRKGIRPAIKEIPVDGIGMF